MLEHVPDPESIIKACQKLLKPGGTAVFSTNNRKPKSYLYAILGAEYILRMVPAGTHDYDKFIKPSEQARWSRNAGLTMVDATGLVYNPITKDYALKDNDLDVNYLIVASKPR